MSEQVVVGKVIIDGQEHVVLRMVPVEVFGAEPGFGLCDAVEWWSDCNRAEGHIFRFDDLPGDRAEGDYLHVVVLKGDITKRYGDPG